MTEKQSKAAYRESVEMTWEPGEESDGLPKRAEVIAALKASYRNFMATGANRESDERYEDTADSVINLFRAARQIT